MQRCQLYRGDGSADRALGFIISRPYSVIWKRHLWSVSLSRSGRGGSLAHPKLDTRNNSNNRNNNSNNSRKIPEFIINRIYYKHFNPPNLPLPPETTRSACFCGREGGREGGRERVEGGGSVVVPVIHRLCFEATRRQRSDFSED